MNDKKLVIYTILGNFSLAVLAFLAIAHFILTENVSRYDHCPALPWNRHGLY
ncbi:hypothetical protein ACJROX_02860 [Pseudalkalibacillus sp. A8]|uniref:hypothetical protein n=1 Tax=Pseudalkalibacillus sp. A8 TaxID=3382641 RepID=UPI0038B50644